MIAKLIILSITWLLPLTGAQAQRANLAKMSPLVRRAAMEQSAMKRVPAKTNNRGAELCAFVQWAEGADSVLAKHGCRELARFNHISIASIPLHRLASLSAECGVMRIEAGQSCTALMDVTPQYVNALPAYKGMALPQAFTGKGVVVGVQDIGFDLTHPNFYDATGMHYRVTRFWDQLSVDTLGSNKQYVGADFVGEKEILAVAHSRDGYEQTHGTHTAGIAAGSGFTSPYRGMAWESELCMVSNAVTADTVFIDKKDRWKFTSATDALGFKYMLDYAESQGRPCVVSFSEGAHQDLYGDDKLLYEVLKEMVGPGRIIVASAGNAGGQANHLLKPRDIEAAGCDLYNNARQVYFLARSAQPFAFRMTYSPPDAEKVYYEVATTTVLEQPDSLFADTIRVGNEDYGVMMAGYPSCYNEKELAYEVLLQRLNGDHYGSSTFPIHIEAVGLHAKVEFFSVAGYFLNDERHTEPKGFLDEAYAIHTPSSAPDVICVGATSYRTQITNYKGEVRTFDYGTNGKRGYYSSIGPTLDERIKPDVMAPGSNVISSYSSWYLEKHPDASDIRQDVEHFEWNGRTYAWNSNGGTSMSTPVVSGAIALWLQAKPTLTPDEIKGIFQRTCSHHIPELPYPNNVYGYGQIDVYRGLLDILQLSSIKGLSDHQPEQATIALNEAQELEITFDRQPRKPFSIRVFSSNGEALFNVTFNLSESRFAVPMSHLPAGVYAVQLVSPEPSLRGSQLVRTR